MTGPAHKPMLQANRWEVPKISSSNQDTYNLLNAYYISGPVLQPYVLCSIIVPFCKEGN